MAFCSQCGASIADGTRFCPQCGAPVSQQADPTPPPVTPSDFVPAESPAPKKSSRKKWIAVAAILAVVIAVGVLILTLTGKDKKKGSAALRDLSISIDGEAISLANYIDAPEADAFLNALAHGSVSLQADLSSFYEYGVSGTLDATLYTDLEKGRAALRASTDAMGESVSATVYLDNSELALECGALFQGAYGLDLNSLAEDLQSSPLSQLFSLNLDALPTQTQVGALLEDSLQDLEALTADYLDFLLDAAEAAASIQKDKNASFHNISVTQITLTLDQNGLAEITEKLLRKAMKDDKLLPTLTPFLTISDDSTADPEYLERWLSNLSEQDIQDILGDIRSDEFEGTVSLYLSNRTGSLVGLDAELREDDESATDTIINLLLGESLSTTDQIGFRITEYYDDDYYTSGLSYNVTENSDSNYSAKLTIQNDDETEDIAFLDYSRGSGSFVLTIDDVTILGTMFADAQRTSIAVSSVYADNQAFECSLSMTFEPGTSCPSLPKYKNVFRLSQDELLKLLQEIQNSSLGSLLIAAQDFG